MYLRLTEQHIYRLVTFAIGVLAGKYDKEGKRIIFISRITETSLSLHRST